MNRTRVSLYYLGTYLTVIGIALLVAPHATLKILQSNGDYGDVFPRVAGMLMSGLGLSIFGMIRARSERQYPTTLFVRTYFLVCIVAFYLATSDPMFLVLGAIVALGFVMTLGSYLADRKALHGA
jgi:small basic protein